MPYEPWPAVPGIERGMIVHGVPHGRRFRVLRADEWVVVGEFDPWNKRDTRVCTGPYALLQALDDKQCTVTWPRSWYATIDDEPGLDLV